MKEVKCPIGRLSYLLNEFKNGKDVVYLYERVNTDNDYKYCVGSWIPSQTTGGNDFTNDYKTAFNIYLTLKQEYQSSIQYIQGRLFL